MEHTQRIRSFLPSRQGWCGRAAIILGLFAAQGLWLSYRFDAASIAGSEDGWRRFFELTPLLLRFAISLFIAVAVLGSNRLWMHAQTFAETAQQHHRWWIWFCWQWIAFGFLSAASFVVFDEGRGEVPFSAVWGMIWIVSALATSICCLFGLAPSWFWGNFVRRERGILLAGLALSLGATVGGRLFQRLWIPLGDSTFRLVEFWLGFFYTDSIVSDVSARLLGTTTFCVEIAPQCSGYEGIGLVSVFVLTFLAVFRQTLRFPHAWLLLPIGAGVIWICNSLRIATLILIGTEYSASVALGGFHSQAGWILFNLVSLGLMSAALKSRFFTKSVDKTVRAAGPATPYLMPFLALTAFSMIIAAMVEDAMSLYPLLVIASMYLLWLHRSVLPRTWQCSRYAVLHGVGIYAIWVGLAWLSHPTSGAIEYPLPDCRTIPGLTWTVFRIVGAVVTVPLIEELAFRGFLLRRLTQIEFQAVNYRDVPLAAVVCSSVAFGVMHEYWLGGIVAGISYAVVARQGRNLADPILAHAVTNGLLTMTVLATGATWLW